MKGKARLPGVAATLISACWAVGGCDGPGAATGRIQQGLDPDLAGVAGLFAPDPDTHRHEMAYAHLVAQPVAPCGDDEKCRFRSEAVAYSRTVATVLLPLGNTPNCYDDTTETDTYLNPFWELRGPCTGTWIGPHQLITAGHCGYPDAVADYKCIRERPDDAHPDPRPCLRVIDPATGGGHDVTHIARVAHLAPELQPGDDLPESIADGSLAAPGAGGDWRRKVYDSEEQAWYSYEDFWCYPLAYHYGSTDGCYQRERTDWPSGETILGDQLLLECHRPAVGPYDPTEPGRLRDAPGLLYGATDFSMGEDGLPPFPDDPSRYFVTSVGQNSLVRSDPQAIVWDRDAGVPLVYGPHYHAGTAPFLFLLWPTGLPATAVDPPLTPGLGFHDYMVACHGFSGSSTVLVPRAGDEPVRMVGTRTSGTIGTGGQVCDYTPAGPTGIWYEPIEYMGNTGPVHLDTLYDQHRDYASLSGIFDLNEDYARGTGVRTAWTDDRGRLAYFYQRAHFNQWNRAWWHAHGLGTDIRWDGTFDIRSVVGVSLSRLVFERGREYRAGAWFRCPAGSVGPLELSVARYPGAVEIARREIPCRAGGEWRRAVLPFSVVADGSRYSSPWEYIVRLASGGGDLEAADLSIVDDDWWWTFDSADERTAWRRTAPSDLDLVSPDGLKEGAATVVRRDGFAGVAGEAGALVNYNLNLHDERYWVVDYRAIQLSGTPGSNGCYPVLLEEPPGGGPGTRQVRATYLVAPSELTRTGWRWQRLGIVPTPGGRPQGIAFLCPRGEVDWIDWVAVRPVAGFADLPPQLPDSELGVDDRTEDFDGDGLTGEEEACPWSFESGAGGNTDGDLVPDACDNCVEVENDDQANADGDDFGDACDLCPATWGVGNVDSDGDGYGDDCDNCPDVSNPDQADCDKDLDIVEEGRSIGDACDPDPCVGLGSTFGSSTETGACPSGVVCMVDHGRLYDFSFQPRGFEGSSDTRRLNTGLRRCQCTRYAAVPGDEPTDLECEAGAGRDDFCPRDGRVVGNPVTRTGWVGVSRVVDEAEVEAPNWPRDGAYAATNQDASIVVGQPYYREGLRPVGTSRVEFHDRVIWDWRNEGWRAGEIAGTGTCPSPDGCTEQWAWIWMRPEGWVDRDEYSAMVHLDYTETIGPGFEILDWVWSRGYTIGGPKQGDPLPATRTQTPSRYWKAREFIKIFDPGDPPFEDSPYKVPDPRPGAGAAAFAFGRLDTGSMNLDFLLPCRSTDPKQPFDMASPMLAAASDGDSYWLFGGRDAAGNTSNGLWWGVIARTGKGDAIPTDVVAWTPLSFDKNPPPRTGAVFQRLPDGSLFLLGGRTDGSNLLSDLWFFQPAANVDAAVSGGPGSIGGIGAAPAGSAGTAPAGEIAAGPSPYLGAWSPGVTSDESIPGLAEAASARWGWDIYIFGGRIDDGISARLWRWDGTRGRLSTLDSAAPLARAEATMAIADSGRRLYLYGGFDGIAWRNDLWSYDLATQVWRQERADCTSGECPPASDGAFLAADSAGALALVPGADPAAQPLWAIQPNGEATWLSFDRLIDDPAAGDCDGDGERDPQDGWRCAAGSEWYSPLGRNVCGATGGPVCNAPDGFGMVVASLDLPQAQAFSLAGSTVVVVGDGDLWKVDVGIPDAPSILGRARPLGWGTDVATSGGYAWVASTYGLEVYDVRGPGDLLRLAALPLPGFALGVALRGGRAYVSTTRGLAVVDAGNPEAPVEVGWVYHAGIPRTSARVIAAAGIQVHVGSRDHLLTFDVSDPAVPVLLDDTRMGGWVNGLRREGDLVYGHAARPSLRGPAGDAFVLRAEEGTGPIRVGDHGVADWVMGMEQRAGLAYRLDGDRFEIAEVR